MPKFRELTAREREALASSLKALRERTSTPEQRAAFLAECESIMSSFTAERIARAIATDRARAWAEE